MGWNYQEHLERCEPEQSCQTSEHVHTMYVRVKIQTGSRSKAHLVLMMINVIILIVLNIDTAAQWCSG